MNFQPALMNVDRLMKLNEVETVLSKVFGRSSMPNRKTIYSWIEDGRLEAIQIGRGDNFYVYESSLNSFIESIQPRRQKLAA